MPPEVDCKTSQTEESFLQLYRNRKNRRPEPKARSSSSGEGGSCSPEAGPVLAVRTAASKSSHPAFRRYEPAGPEAIRPLSASPRSGSLFSEAAGRIHAAAALPSKFRRSTIYLTASDCLGGLEWRPPESAAAVRLKSSPKEDGAVLYKGTEDVRMRGGTAKPVRGQCVTSAASQPASSGAGHLASSGGCHPAANNNRPSPVAVAPGPYRRSLSRSSHCLLAAAPPPQMVRTGGGLRRFDSAGLDSGKFYIDIYEGQSTLV